MQGKLNAAGTSGKTGIRSEGGSELHPAALAAWATGTRSRGGHVPQGAGCGARSAAAPLFFLFLLLSVLRRSSLLCCFAAASFRRLRWHGREGGS
jgi:hypothetical protein